MGNPHYLVIVGRLAVCLGLAGLLASGACVSARLNDRSRGSGLAPSAEMISNGGFEKGLDGWTAWGTNADLISIDSKVARSGSRSARIAAGHNALFFVTSMAASMAYEIRFSYRLEGKNPTGEVALSYYTKGGAHRSGGFKIIGIAPGKAGASGWSDIRQVFMPSNATVSCQIAFAARGESVLWIDDVSLRAVPRPAGMKPAPDPWIGLAHRTQKPLFAELLTDRPGGYAAVCWSHNLNRENLPEARRRDFPDIASWDRQAMATYIESAKSGLGYMDLPGAVKGESAPRTAAFHREMFDTYGVSYDLWTEGSPTPTGALALGAELLNPKAKALGARPVVSVVDPHYLDAQEKMLTDLARRFKGESYVGVYYGKDEPSARIPDGSPEQWGAYGKQMAREVLEEFGYGRYAAPTPKDPAFEKDPNKPLRWIAYNRWASGKWFASRDRLHKALHAVDPNAVYSPADYWFMSGFIPFDYPRLAACSDLMEIDPYGSSAERRRGRGVYNHGFGPKFMSDLTGKPVRVIAQAFDYAGYAMKPEDLREWVSQSMRCGASAISYYTMDNPQYKDPSRWKMMLHLAKTVTSMNRVALPTDPDTAILYASYTHMSVGASTGADQIYSAHALVGEMAGSWYRFVADSQIELGERSLSGYKAVYLPLGKYMTPEATAKIEEYVRAGGVLVCGDAETFGNDLEGNDTSAARERILGVSVLGPRRASKVLLTLDFGDGTKSGTELPLFETELWGETSMGRAREIRLTDRESRIIGVYSNGDPAIVVHRLGKGKVITFAANPFAPEVAVEKTEWPAMFRDLQKGFGCKVDKPIWRFVLPASTTP